MLEVQRTYARRLTGHRVRVACASGTTIEGRLIGSNGHSLWVVQGDTDHIVPLGDVVGLAPAA